jgi:DNA-binding CsgD family transcriptional regulator
MCLKTGQAARDRGQLPFAVLAYHDAVRLGAVRQTAQTLEEVADATDGPFPPAAVSHQAALADRDRDGLLAAADTFERLGMLLAAAEAVVEARELDSRGDRRLGARAAALVARCEGAMSPKLAERVRPGAHLTGRELTVARLASEGYSSKSIARQLAVSVRTIDSHLTRAYKKLGVAGRDELASTLSTEKLPDPN